MADFLAQVLMLEPFNVAHTAHEAGIVRHIVSLLASIIYDHSADRK